MALFAKVGGAIISHMQGTHIIKLQWVDEDTYRTQLGSIQDGKKGRATRGIVQLRVCDLGLQKGDAKGHAGQ